MTCASCQHHVEAALRATAGVESARVDLMAHRASVVFDPELAAPQQLVEAIRGAGYDAVVPRIGDSDAHAENRAAGFGRYALELYQRRVADRFNDSVAELHWLPCPGKPGP